MTKHSTRTGIKIVQQPKKVEASLWRRFRFESEKTCREKLFKYHQPFARKQAARQFYRRPKYGSELFDFEQQAYIGLLQAIDRFDPLKNIPFRAYARYRITGIIGDGALKSSENAAIYGYKSRTERDRLNSMRSNDEGKSKDAISQLSNLAVGLAIGILLNDTETIDVDAIADHNPNAYETLSWRELQKTMAAEVRRLPTGEKQVVEYHYMNDISFTQIAELLQLSKSRVSQIHKSAIMKLRKRLRTFA